MSAPPKPLSYADMLRKSTAAAPVVHAQAAVPVVHAPPVAAIVPAPPVAPAPLVVPVVPAPVAHVLPAAPVRRARATSIGGSDYQGTNSGDVTRTDSHTGAITTISGGEMHRAVNLGHRHGAPAATRLHQQNHEYNDLNLAGPGGEQHAPMGCVEARIESAIAFHHIGNGSRRNTRAAWDNSSRSVLTAVTDQRANVVPACGWCAARGH